MAKEIQSVNGINSANLSNYFTKDLPSSKEEDKEGKSSRPANVEEFNISLASILYATSLYSSLLSIHPGAASRYMESFCSNLINSNRYGEDRLKKASIGALGSAVSEGVISQSVGDQILKEADNDIKQYGEAFGGSIGSGSNTNPSNKAPTIKARGSVQTSPLELPAGFLWKPVSDSSGKLAILLPPNWAGEVWGVKVLSPEGEILEEGKFGGNGNGGRDHYRFNSQGGNYPAGSIVAVTFKDGSIKNIEVENTSSRNER